MFSSSQTRSKVIVTGLFVMLGFLLMQVPFTKLTGANVKFSLFDFFGPIAGAFLGSIPGMLTVLGMQLVNWAWHGFAMDTGTIIRFFPMLAATLYFSKKSRWFLVIPVAAIGAFLAHPEGRAAAPFTLYWLIPIVAYFGYDKFVLARALGATFTAHAVGGTLWIWAFNMKAAAWIGLIPVVWKERGLMALGIVLTYLAFKRLYAYSRKRGWIQELVVRPVSHS